MSHDKCSTIPGERFRFRVSTCTQVDLFNGRQSHPLLPPEFGLEVPFEDLPLEMLRAFPELRDMKIKDDKALESKPDFIRLDSMQRRFGLFFSDTSEAARNHVDNIHTWSNFRGMSLDNAVWDTPCEVICRPHRTRHVHNGKPGGVEVHVGLVAVILNPWELRMAGLDQFLKDEEDLVEKIMLHTGV